MNDPPKIPVAPVTTITLFSKEYILLI